MFRSSSHTKKNESINPNMNFSVLNLNAKEPVRYRKMDTDYCYSLFQRNDKSEITLYLKTRTQPLAQAELFIYLVNQKKWFWAGKLYKDNNSLQLEAFNHPPIQKQLALAKRQFLQHQAFRNVIIWYGYYENNNKENNEEYNRQKGHCLQNLAVKKMESSQRYFSNKKYEKAIILTQHALNAMLSMPVWNQAMMTKIYAELSIYMQLLGSQSIQDAEKVISIYKEILEAIAGIDNVRLAESNKNQIRLEMRGKLAYCQVNLAVQYYNTGEHRKAITLNQEAVHTAKLIDDKVLLETIYRHLGQAQHEAARIFTPETQVTTTTTLTCSPSKKRKLEVLNQSPPREVISLEEKKISEKKEGAKERKRTRLIQKSLENTSGKDKNIILRDFAERQLALGKQYFRKGNFEQAVIKFKGAFKIVSLIPESDKLFLTRPMNKSLINKIYEGLICSLVRFADGSKETEKAIAALETAADILNPMADAGNPLLSVRVNSLFMRLASRYADKGEYEKAITACNKVLDAMRMYPRNNYDYTNATVIERKASYQRALVVGPSEKTELSGKEKESLPKRQKTNHFFQEPAQSRLSLDSTVPASPSINRT